jgi:class 3 adenylate cyclase
MGKDIELAILFADVVGSTRIYEVMGDLRARDMVLTCVEIMRAATEQNHGTVIKTIGDEIMATFPTANDALNAASRMQHDIRIHSELKVEGQPIAIRIGGHFGPVVLEKHDVFGSTVNTANRMTSQAKSGQIMTTAATVELLSPDWRASVRQIDLAALSVQGAEVMQYEAIWQTEDITSMLPSIHLGGAADRRAVRLRLVMADRELVLDETRPQIAIGRADENDVIIRGNLISRIHARIEVERNRFVLIDQSTNGTFVTTEEGRESFARRDSVTLEGRGLIGLGRLPEPTAQDAIAYQLED